MSAIDRVAEAIAHWDFVNAVGREPTPEESAALVLPPHLEIAAKVVGIVKLADAACAAGEHVHVALVDSKRDELRDAERRLDDAIAVANAEKGRATRLRAVIESAPHAWDCAQETYDGHDETRPCTCWKATA